MQRSDPIFSNGWILGVGLLVVGFLVGGALLLLADGSYEAVGALVVAPILTLVSLPILARRASLDGDRRLFWLFVAALVLKLAGGLARYFVGFDVYGGNADAGSYHLWGERIADGFAVGDFDTGLETLSGTDFIRFLTGLVYTLTGPNLLAGFLVFSWLGFWGLYFFYRAFRVGVPEGRPRVYVSFVFFLPSLLYWPSSVGKEAWMTFALGIGALGIARIMTGRMRRGLMVAGLGLWLAALVRPHVAGIMAVALVAGFLFRRARKEHARDFALLGKGIAVAGLTVIALVLVSRTDAFLRQSGIELGGGIREALQGTAERTSIGGSSFQPSILQSPLTAPLAVITVLYRPLLLEAHNPQSLVAGLEGTFLLVITVVRWRWILAAATSVRRQPYVAFAIAYTALFIVAFSAIANFGLLARERVQVLPIFLVLLAVPPPGSSERPRFGRRERIEREPAPSSGRVE